MLKSELLSEYDGLQLFYTNKGAFIDVEVDNLGGAYSLTVNVRKKGSSREYSEVILILEPEDDGEEYIDEKDKDKNYINYVSNKIINKVKHICQVAEEDKTRENIQQKIKESIQGNLGLLDDYEYELRDENLIKGRLNVKENINNKIDM